jgi:hypothetical protein
MPIVTFGRVEVDKSRLEIKTRESREWRGVVSDIVIPVLEG